MFLQHLMYHRVSVTRPTPSKGTSGAEVDTYTTVYSAQPCFIQPATAKWIIQYEQRQINITHNIYFNKYISVKAGDRMTFNVRLFLVQGVRNVDEQGVVIVCDVLEIPQ